MKKKVLSDSEVFNISLRLLRWSYSVYKKKCTHSGFQINAVVKINSAECYS